MNNECIPLKSAAYTRVITVHIDNAGANVTGKCFVAAVVGRQSGGLAGLAADPLPAGDGSDYITLGPPSAGAAVEGVAMWDQVKNAKVPVISGKGTILPVTVGTGGVTAGQELEVDAAGKVVTYSSGIKVGRALTTAAATADCEVELY